MEEKICFECKVSKPVTDFHKDSSREGGLYPICKVCRSARLKAQYAANQPQIRKREKDKYHANPEKYRAQAKRYRDKVSDGRREEITKYQRDYYQQNKEKWAGYYNSEKARAYSATYRKANPEKVREMLRDWHRRHPHYVAQAAAKRREQFENIENTLTEEQIQELLEEYDYCCAYCSIDLQTLPGHQRTLDHVVPVSQGGGHTKENVVPCCRPCNARKRDRPVISMLKYAEDSRSKNNIKVLAERAINL